MTVQLETLDEKGLLNLHNEKAIQQVIHGYLEKRLGIIVNESLASEPRLQAHQFLILDSFKNAVESLNIADIRGKGYRESEAVILQRIVDNFTAAFEKTTSNGERYTLIFGKGTRSVPVTDRKGTEVYIQYRVVDTDLAKGASGNKLECVREKRISTKGLATADTEQLPDFAFYINGIPLYVVEVKTPTQGLQAAFEDYQNKKTYHYFLGCIGTDGRNAFLSMNPYGMAYSKWEDYGNNLKTDRTSGLVQLLDELVLNQFNCIFYLDYGVFTKTSLGSTTCSLEHLRVQQYYTLRKLYTALRASDTTHSTNTFLKVVKHVQRSGKSLTIKAMVYLVCRSFPDLFSKIYIQTPDTTINDQFVKLFGDVSIPNRGRAIVINSRDAYERTIKSKKSGVYLMNMQKIDKDMCSVTNKQSDVLIILDEVHTHQLGNNALVREGNYPNAAYITFSATPRIKESTDGVFNLVLAKYSDNGKYLDEFNSVMAKKLGIIVPVVYQQTTMTTTFNDEQAKLFDDLSKTRIEQTITQSSEIQQLIEDELVHESVKLDSYGVSGLDKQHLLDERREELLSSWNGKIYSQVNDHVLRQLKNSQIEQKIQMIVSDVQHKRTNDYADQVSKKPLFKTKAFWVVDDVAMAVRIMGHLSKHHGGRVVEGVRFAADFSWDGASDSSVSDIYKEYDHTINSFASLDTINGAPAYGSTVKDDFDSQQSDSVDVLIIVGKYLMGYDNPYMTCVYLDTTIREPSRLFQLVTRPATMQPFKKYGYLVDFSYDSVNFETYKKALRWYEGADQMHTFIVDEDTIKSGNKVLHYHLTKIAGLLNVSKSDLVKPSLRTQVLTLVTDQSALSRFFHSMEAIAAVMRSLIAPRYYKDHVQPIYNLLRQLHELTGYLKAKQLAQVTVTQSDIKLLVQDVLGILGFNSIDQFIDVAMADVVERKVDESELAEIKLAKRFHQAKVRLSRSGGDRHGPGKSIYQRLSAIVDEIELASALNSQEDNISDLEEALAALESQRKNTIQNRFNDCSLWYELYLLTIGIFAKEDPAASEHNGAVDELAYLTSEWYTGQIKGFSNDAQLNPNSITIKCLKNRAQLLMQPWFAPLSNKVPLKIKALCTQKDYRDAWLDILIEAQRRNHINES